MTDLALVTGGETGIGRAILDLLRARGYEVRSVSRRTGTDLLDRAAIDRLVKNLTRIDLLVNNAGIAESAPLARTSDEMWDRHLALDVTAPFLLCRAALPLLRKSGHGQIINIASTAGLRGGPYIAAYAAAKHALVGLSRALAAEIKDVSVDWVCPGFVDSELTDRSVARIAKETGLAEAEARKRLAAMNPCGRLIRPDEVAASVGRLLDRPGTGREVVLE
ncbi:MAG TPA: SDR family oxidoreductase [Planctomycetota bacterium]|nr:SDR family oxidoreductase [Planctomycetota bacterium]